MPTVNEVLGDALQKTITYVVKNWKSSLSSILTTGLAFTTYLMASSTIKPRTAVIALSINGALKLIVGFMQKDATTIKIPAGTQPTISLPEGATIDQDTHSTVSIPPTP
jgi:hypothetical protein